MVVKNIIGHLDMDAFFAAVEEREKPWLKGMPVVVGADPDGGHGRGVVATANYAARVYGVHSALPISKAWQLSERARRESKPAVMFITPRFGKYGAASKEVVAIVRRYVPIVQMTSVDEMYLDLSFTGSYKKAEALARKLKAAVKRKTKLTGSIGVGPNKMIAKIASDFQKPDGLVVVPDRKAADFIAPLPVRALLGVGPKMEAKLARLRIKTVADLRKLSQTELQKRFGSWGTSLYTKARGEGSTDLTSEHLAKSVGEHETFRNDTTSMKFVIGRLEALAADIVKRLRRRGFTGFRTVVLTVRFSDFETKQRSVTTKEVMHTAHELELKAMKLALPFFEKKENPRGKPIRMVGLRVEKLL